MSFRRLHGPGGNGAGTGDGQRPPEERRAFLQMKEASRSRTRSAPLTTCDPQGKNDDLKLENRLRAAVEPELKDLAEAGEMEGKAMGVVTALSDKSHLNPIRLLGGEACGDQAMLAFSDAIGSAMGDIEASNKAVNNNERTSLNLMRVAPRSDEGVIVIGGAGLPANAHLQFEMALEVERIAQDLSRYTYRVEVSNGHGVEVCELDLEAFSRILKYPDMVKAGHFKVATPLLIQPGAASGFILEEIRKLENSEAGFFERLRGIYRGNGGLPEVRTPFKGSLKARGESRMTRGAFVEIKLQMTPEQAALFLPFTQDIRGPSGELFQEGTRKGFAEIFSGRGGMRFLNTFFGKARSNSILTPITLAMDDLQHAGVDVVPVSGGYLQYWLDAPDSASTAEMVERAISGRINSRLLTDDSGHIDIAFRPSVLTMSASGVDLDDVRARFILKSLGREPLPAQALSRADFLVNFLEHVNSDIQEEIFGMIALEENGGRSVALSEAEQNVIESVRRVCSMRRTIRDTEDLIWTLRNDTELPLEIQAKKASIEQGFWAFALERYTKMFYLISKKIEREMKRERLLAIARREFGQPDAEPLIDLV